MGALPIIPSSHVRLLLSSCLHVQNASRYVCGCVFADGKTVRRGSAVHVCATYAQHLYRRVHDSVPANATSHRCHRCPRARSVNNAYTCLHDQ